MKPKIVLTILVFLLALSLGFLLFNEKALSPTKDNQEQPHDVSTVEDVFPKDKMSITDASSLWLIVNKSRSLRPADYFPANLISPNVPLRLGSGSESMTLRADAADALKKMHDAAVENGLDFKLASGFRSHSSQATIYSNEVRQYGQTTADTQSARPGHSEHQTGLAVDLQDINGQCVVTDCFGELPIGKWLAENSYKYGFILRYPQGKDGVTGYRYEPWHFRFVGVELSTEMSRQHIKTLEEFFGVIDPPTY